MENVVCQRRQLEWIAPEDDPGLLRGVCIFLKHRFHGRLAPVMERRCTFVGQIIPLCLMHPVLM